MIYQILDEVRKKMVNISLLLNNIFGFTFRSEKTLTSPHMSKQHKVNLGKSMIITN